MLVVMAKGDTQNLQCLDFGVHVQHRLTVGFRGLVPNGSLFLFRVSDFASP